MIKITIPKIKGESEKMHHRLVIFSTVGERNYQKTADILNDEMSQMSQNESPQRVITPEVLRKTAERWEWEDRCDLELAKKILEDAKELDEQFRAYNKKIIKILEDLIDFLDEKFQEIYKNIHDYALTTQMNLLSAAMNILDKAIYNYRLSCGRSTGNNELYGEFSHDVSAVVEEETKLVYSKDVREMIQNIGDEPDSETQKFLDEVL